MCAKINHSPECKGPAFPTSSQQYGSWLRAKQPIQGTPMVGTGNTCVAKDWDQPQN